MPRPPLSGHETLEAEWREELKVVVAGVRQAAATRDLLRAEREAWRVAQERRQEVLADVRALRGTLDGLDWHGRRNALRRIGTHVKLYKEGDCDPRWFVATRFVVGGAVSLGVARDVPTCEVADDWVLRDGPSSDPAIGGGTVNIYSLRRS